MANNEKKLLKIYDTLKEQRGFLNWWPAESEFEIIVGAILTQNTSWINVEKAISNLKKNKKLDFESILRIPLKRLALLIKPSGYFNQKAKKLKNFVNFVKDNFSGSIEEMKKLDLYNLREILLQINGIGNETADSIMLYAFSKPVFVIDAYTIRIFSRLGLIKGELNYLNVQKFFMKQLPLDITLYNDFHAQIVLFGKEVCKKKPLCINCPIINMCDYGKKNLKRDD